MDELALNETPIGSDLSSVGRRDDTVAPNPAHGSEERIMSSLSDIKDKRLLLILQVNSAHLKSSVGGYPKILSVIKGWSRPLP